MTEILLNGQPFNLIGEQPHVTKDGRKITLQRWSSRCTTCGAPFIALTIPGRHPDVRRCEDHRLPGRRIKKEMVICEDIDVVPFFKRGKGFRPAA